MEPMENVKTAIKKFLKKDWKFIQLLKNAWTANKYLTGAVAFFLILVFDQTVKYLAVSQKTVFFQK